MIKFCCEHCGHKIGAPDDYAGKKARCSKCKQPVKIPAESQEIKTGDSDMIKFRCEKCNQKIAVKAIHAGKRVKCNKCQNICVIKASRPATQSESATRSSTQKAVSDNMLNFDSEDLSALAAGQTVEIERPKPKPEQEKIDDAQRTQNLKTKTPKQRMLPWPIDILLYPTSIAGLLNIVLVVVCNFVLGFFFCMGALLQLLISFYIIWYCCECIRDSASGGLRAPDAFSGGLDIWEEAFQYLKVMATCILFISPVIIYVFYYCVFTETKPNNVIVISLLGYSAAFFPMALLAMVLFDSLSALNPWLLVRSIISTFPQYVGLVILLYGLGIIYYFVVFAAAMGSAAASAASPVPGSEIMGAIGFHLVEQAASLWLTLVLCHLLGRFYYKYEEKLYWEV
ncbi:MAG: DUF4013 domain-containing protein [Sedimentisphaerales bacterium]|nr:DUF4013 domain-containing protein [Sedimentisphaerales bacterium]